MCYSAIVKQQLKELSESFHATIDEAYFESLNEVTTAQPKKVAALVTRIFPKSHGIGIVTHHKGSSIATKHAKQGFQGRLLVPMRYGIFPPPQLSHDRTFEAVFNARKDNLTSPFWKESFGHHHGLMVIESFFEWVAVKDLLKANVVSLTEVKAEFSKQMEERRARVLAKGKAFKPTPTELKDPHLRQIMIEFHPQDGQDLVVPLLCNERIVVPEFPNFYDIGCAMITDDPPEEVRLAGHGRCPLILPADQSETIERWLNPKGQSHEELLELLTTRRRVSFQHRLPLVA